MVALFARHHFVVQSVNLQPQMAIAAEFQQLNDLMRRRDQLVEMQVEEKNRLSHLPEIVRSDGLIDRNAADVDDAVSDLDGIRILLVDDNADSLDLLAGFVHQLSG